MDFDAIRKLIDPLIDTLIQKQIDEFEFEQGDLRIRIRRGVPVMTVPAVSAVPAPVASMPGAAASAPSAGLAQAEAPPEDLFIVHSPIVGTFYGAPAPGSSDFVKPGDQIEPGQVLCIVEAMKLMNEIESEVSGELVKKLVTNGQPVEYGEPLFAIRLKK